MNDLIRYEITLESCDDSTTVFMDLTLDERDFMKRLETEVNSASSYNCMPVLYFSVAG